MADYRQFCDACGHEVGFGSHRPGCSQVIESNRIARERADKQVAMQKSVQELNDEELESEWRDRMDQCKEAYLILREANADGRLDYVKRQMAVRQLLRAAIDRRHNG